MSGKSDVILFIISELSGGGAERVSVSLMNLLKKNGHDLVVVCTESTTNTYGLNESIPIFFISYKDTKRYDKLSKVIEKHSIGITVLTNHSHKENLQDITWLKRRGIKVIAQEHNMFYYPLYMGHYSFFKERLLAYKNVDVLTCLSKMDLTLWRASGISQVCYVPNLMGNFNGEKEYLEFADRTKDVIIVGKLNEVKGLYNLPFYIERIHGAVPSAKISIYGNFSSKANKLWFFTELKKRGLTSTVNWQPFTSDILQHIRNAKLLFIPSLVEGSPMVILEARQCGTPCMIQGLNYIDNAYDGVVHVQDSNNSFKLITQKLLTDANYWKQFSLATQIGLENWGERHILKIWEEILSKLEIGEPVCSQIQDQNIYLDYAVQEFYRSMDFISFKHLNTKYYKDESDLRNFLFALQKVKKIFSSFLCNITSIKSKNKAKR